mgnify:CR=1 FL=1
MEVKILIYSSDQSSPALFLLLDLLQDPQNVGSLLRTAEAAYANEWQRCKLYFMIGLPSERPEYLEAIVDLVQRLRKSSAMSSFERTH